MTTSGKPKVSKVHTYSSDTTHKVRDYTDHETTPGKSDYGTGGVVTREHTADHLRASREQDALKHKRDTR